MSAMQRWVLRLHPQAVKIARLPAGSPLPHWARGGPLTSVTWNAHETSVVAPDEAVPAGIEQAGPFHAFEVKGPLDFTLVGVLHDLLEPLAGEGISVVTMSTFDTDWILVPVVQCPAATRAWRDCGHTVEDTPDPRHPVAGSATPAAPAQAGAPIAAAPPDAPPPDLLRKDTP